MPDRLLPVRRRRSGAGDPAGQQLLAHLAALAALGLRLAEQFNELLIPVALGVLDVALQPQRVAQGLLGEPDQVVVLVLGAGDLTGLLVLAHGYLLWNRMGFLCRGGYPGPAPPNPVPALDLAAAYRLRSRRTPTSVGQPSLG